MSGCEHNQEVTRSQLDSTSLFSDRPSEGVYPTHDPIDTSRTQRTHIRKKERECVWHLALQGFATPNFFLASGRANALVGLCAFDASTLR